MSNKWSKIEDSLVERQARLPALMAAASSDDGEAQLALAWEYTRGEVVTVDIVKAWQLFDRAASNGNEDAIVQYARFLQLRSVPDGIRQLRGLAASGSWKAQYCLAQQYQTLPGRLNQLKAIVWFERSFRKALDLDTLVCTRGRDFPLPPGSVPQMPIMRQPARDRHVRTARRPSTGRG